MTTNQKVKYDKADFDVEGTKVILAKFDFKLLEYLDPEIFQNFGINNSKVYFDNLLKFMDEAKLGPKERMMVVTLSTAIRSKKRVLSAMRVYEGASWYKDVFNFYTDKVCQYTSEELGKRIAAVHIPSSCPFLAARCWLQIAKNPDVESFLNNTWAAQIFLSEDLLARQRTWEEHLWTHDIKKGGVNFEVKGFQPEYWKTKSNDRYYLLDSKGKPWGTEGQKAGKEEYTEEDIVRWIATKKRYKVSGKSGIPKKEGQLSDSDSDGDDADFPDPKDSAAKESTPKNVPKERETGTKPKRAPKDSAEDILSKASKQAVTYRGTTVYREDGDISEDDVVRMTHESPDFVAMSKDSLESYMGVELKEDIDLSGLDVALQENVKNRFEAFFERYFKVPVVGDGLRAYKKRWLKVNPRATEKEVEEFERWFRRDPERVSESLTTSWKKLDEEVCLILAVKAVLDECEEYRGKVSQEKEETSTPLVSFLNDTVISVSGGESSEGTDKEEKEEEEH